MEEYVSEAKEVVEEPFFGEAYDHEKANNEQWYEDGYEEGIEQGIEKGIEQGEKNKQIEMIKALYKNGASLELISKSTNLSIDELRNILGLEK